MSALCNVCKMYLSIICLSIYNNAHYIYTDLFVFACNVHGLCAYLCFHVHNACGCVYEANTSERMHACTYVCKRACVYRSLPLGTILESVNNRELICCFASKYHISVCYFGGQHFDNDSVGIGLNKQDFTHFLLTSNPISVSSFILSDS